VLDYGCGKGVLADQLNKLKHISCEKYDPAIPDYDVRPKKVFDCLINTDVLEHIPEDELDGTLKYGSVEK
jgi:2-polyprenyl-3-methyl-5-hydroxy-6-metoxy-1,4-benzoquinol methylase